LLIVVQLGGDLSGIPDCFIACDDVPWKREALGELDQ
jgi:hypothetical protein